MSMTKLNQNTTDLQALAASTGYQEVLDLVNALPDAGGSSGGASMEWKNVVDLPTTYIAMPDEEVTTYYAEFPETARLVILAGHAESSLTYFSPVCIYDRNLGAKFESSTSVLIDVTELSSGVVGFKIPANYSTNMIYLII